MREPPQHTVLAAGAQLAQTVLQQHWDGPQVQRLLFAARQRFGHALCACRPQPLKLQIRLRGDKCHLAVWPRQHGEHDKHCLFFAGGLPRTSPTPGGQAPVPVTQAPTVRTARTALWLGPPGTAPRGAQPVSARTLALRLWEAASLCRWHPGWSRDWGRTRYQLHQAARAFTLNSCPLEHLLFVPRDSRPHASSEQDPEWAQFVGSLRGNPYLAPRVLVAPVEALQPPTARADAAVWLRRGREPVDLHPSCWQFLSRACGDAISAACVVPARTDRQEDVADRPACVPEVIGSFVIERSTDAALCSRAAWLLAVHRGTFIPAPTQELVRLIDALVAGGHAFHHPLHSYLRAARRTSSCATCAIRPARRCHARPCRSSSRQRPSASWPPARKLPTAWLRKACPPGGGLRGVQGRAATALHCLHASMRRTRARACSCSASPPA
jgi:hypothetical protein